MITNDAENRREDDEACSLKLEASRLLNENDISGGRK